MKVKLQRIGNSKGIILPKEILNKYHFVGEVDLVEGRGHLEIHPLASKRADWEDRFKAASVNE